MKMKQFFHLTFVFLLLVCLAHSANAITELGKKRHFSDSSGNSARIAMVYHHR
jgi:hypothetical protein